MENKKINKDHVALKNMAGVFEKLVDKKKITDVNAIELKNVSFFIKKRLLLNNVSFEVRQGEIHGFLGPNGAGKTTTIKNIINAYVTRSKESNIKIMGHEVDTIEAKREIAYIPEYASFPTHLSLEGYLIAMARFHNLNKVEAKKRADELIEILELDQHRNISPNKFSSGMKKKVLLAQALMSNPSVLILDEPAANLDPSARNMLFKALKDLSKNGITIFISSHILAELEGLIDSLTMINLGNIVYSGSVKEMINRIKSSDNYQFAIKVYCHDKAKNEISKIANKLKLQINSEVAFVKVKSKTKKELFKLLGEIAKNEIEISSVAFDKVSLQDIYDKEFAQ